MIKLDEPSFQARALRHKVQVVSASDYYVADSPGNEFPLGLSKLSDRSIREGVHS